jgi:hypothetical protein
MLATVFEIVLADLGRGFVPPRENLGIFQLSDPTEPVRKCLEMFL